MPGAIDYLQKPIEKDEVARAVVKIKDEVQKNQNAINDQLRHLTELLTHHAIIPEPRLGICMADKIVFINITDIHYCEANGSYTNVYVNDGKKMIASKSLGEFELQLANHNFFRIHRSSLINLTRIKEFQRHNGGYVIMENGQRLEVSHRKQKEFLDVIHDIVV